MTKMDMIKSLRTALSTVNESVDHLIIEPLALQHGPKCVEKLQPIPSHHLANGLDPLSFFICCTYWPRPNGDVHCMDSARGEHIGVAECAGGGRRRVGQHAASPGSHPPTSLWQVERIPYRSEIGVPEST
jgi:hypothetical protein